MLESVAKHVRDEAPLLETSYGQCHLTQAGEPCLDFLTSSEWLGPGYTALFVRHIQAEADEKAVQLLQRFIASRGLEALVVEVSSQEADKYDKVLVIDLSLG